MTALDIITGALVEINAYAQGDTVSQSDAAFALGKLNDLLDEWAARRVYIYNVNFPTFTLTANLSPHTIGPSAQITNTSLTANLATYTAVNNFAVGTSVTVSGTTNGAGALNVTGPVLAATATSFSIAVNHADIPSAADTGNAITAGGTVPTFATPFMGQRPQRVDQANLILTNVSPAVELPLNIRDSNWWMNQRVKSLTSNVPTDLFYSEDFPNGSLYFWPVPNYAYGVRLKMWGVIPQFPSTGYTFSLPPGYQKGIKLSLARDLVGPYSGKWSPNQEASWRNSMKAIESNNIHSPRGTTLQPGMPGNPMGGGGFNYRSGLPENT